MEPNDPVSLHRSELVTGICSLDHSHAEEKVAKRKCHCTEDEVRCCFRPRHLWSPVESHDWSVPIGSCGQEIGRPHPPTLLSYASKGMLETKVTDTEHVVRAAHGDHVNAAVARGGCCGHLEFGNQI